MIPRDSNGRSRRWGAVGSGLAIDWTFAGIAAVGVDAAQLVARHAEAGELDPAELSGLLDEVLDAYFAGFSEVPPSIGRDTVRFGGVGNLIIRTAFTAVPVELLADPTDELAVLFDRARRPSSHGVNPRCGGRVFMHPFDCRP